MGYRPGSSGGGGGGSAPTGETITAPTTSGSNGTVISKNKTISNPTVPANVYLALPSASAAVAYQEYEVKDGSGLASISTTITITTLSGSIDGVTEDVIDARWGSKTYYTDGANWFVKNESTRELGAISGAGSYLAHFGGADEDPLPAGWSATRTNGSAGDSWDSGCSGWLIQTASFYSGGSNTSSGGDHYSGPTNDYLRRMPRGGTSVLTYAADTYASGTVISFSWMKAEHLAYDQLSDLFFQVNGVSVETFSDSDSNTWQPISYTVPAAGTYEFKWHWEVAVSSGGYFATGYANGVFIDEFTIT